MKTFTIDEQNNITAFGSKEEAMGAGAVFSTQKELAKLSAEWPISRLIEIWNGFAGVAPFGDLKPVKKFTDRKVASTRIWQAIQRLDAGVGPGSAPEQPEPEVAPVPEELTTAVEVAPEFPAPAPESAQEAASVAPQVPDVAPAIAAATTDASPADGAPTADASAPAAEQAAPKTPKAAAKPEPEAAAPRESKAAQVVAMLQRPEGATIGEIMTKMGWQKHTRVHGGHDEKGRPQRGVLQTRGRRALLPHPFQVTSGDPPSWPARLCRGGLFAFTAKSGRTRPGVTLRANVGQLWRSGGYHCGRPRRPVAA